MALPIGARLGSYEIIALLGEGGMGRVYRARDHRLSRDVAIKVLADRSLGDPERRGRFERESRVLASLNHVHVAGIYGVVDTPDGEPALVLELVDGPTLADRIARGPLPMREAVAIARQIADALDAAHERGIVHRDLKPANIKLTANGDVKVLDFGLAKIPDAAVQPAEASLSHSPTAAVATGIGVFLGTAAYMSPEQARGLAVDRRTDIRFCRSSDRAGHLDFQPDATEQATPFLKTKFREGAPQFSPDGRWIAYVSDESGANEVYVRPYPGAGEKVTVSIDGGTEPVWPRQSWQIFYRKGTSMMVVDVTPQPNFSVGRPRQLFDHGYEPSGAFWPNYDVTPDGRRLLMVKPDDVTAAPIQVNVVLNWLDELNQRVVAR